MIVYIYNIGVDLYNGFNGLRHRINWTYFTVLDGLAHPLYSIIPHDNISCERSIRPFVVIRNRCKFSVCVHGAQASAMIYSLVISCIENKQNPYMYFTHLFENLPKLDLTNKEELRKYLPYSRDYQAISEYYQRAK